MSKFICAFLLAVLCGVGFTAHAEEQVAPKPEKPSVEKAKPAPTEGGTYENGDADYGDYYVPDDRDGGYDVLEDDGKCHMTMRIVLPQDEKPLTEFIIPFVADYFGDFGPVLKKAEGLRFDAAMGKIFLRLAIGGKKVSIDVQLSAGELEKLAFKLADAAKTAPDKLKPDLLLKASSVLRSIPRAPEKPRKEGKGMSL
ncbi:MAG: hypothetical protein PHV93_05015 [Candidatus Pacebacteria bacterium]|nr:hypothetical protein [Candidatus Paceibacterota bacterium]